jgi:sialate O-acetylesterase
MNRYYKTGWMAAALLWVGAVIAQQLPQTAPAGPQLLHPIFQDHAVLQRDRPIKLYGETSPRTDVTVTLGTASIKTRAGADGHWSATLPATTAGGPYTLAATANGEIQTASDVLVGDVFLCAGQSNMGFGQRQAQGAADDARTATDAQIRQFNIGTNASLVPRQTFASAVRWVVEDCGQLFRGLLLHGTRVEEDRERARWHGRRRMGRRARAQLGQ